MRYIGKWDSLMSFSDFCHWKYLIDVEFNKDIKRTGIFWNNLRNACSL